MTFFLLLGKEFMHKLLYKDVSVLLPIVVFGGDNYTNCLCYNSTDYIDVNMLTYSNTNCIMGPTATGCHCWLHAMQAQLFSQSDLFLLRCITAFRKFSSDLDENTNLRP